MEVEVMEEKSNGVTMSGTVTGRRLTVVKLLKTGLLEGYPVFYKDEGISLRGTIRGTGILCSCDLCKGNKVVALSQFEIHARKVYKRAPDFIFLENGKSLTDVAKECSKGSSMTLEETILAVINPLAVMKTVVCQNCKGSFLAATLTGKDEHGQLCDSCIISLRSEATPTHSINTRSDNLMEVEEKSNGVIMPGSYSGRRISVTELLKTGLLEGHPVFYNDKSEGISLQGTIRGTGILCSCDLCKGNKVVFLSQFEIHARKVYRRAPDFIFLENGKSLTDVAKECSKVSLRTLEETILVVINPHAVMKTLVCRDCKGSFLATMIAGKDEHGQLCGSCIISLRSEATPTHSINTRGDDLMEDQEKSNGGIMSGTFTGRRITVIELLKTGLLEGYPVFYNYKNEGVSLRGTIRGTGILCSCDLCKENRVVALSQFELHAHKGHRRAQDFTFLENGKSLSVVARECSKVSSRTLEETILAVISPNAVMKTLVCRDCKGSFLASMIAGEDEHGQLCCSCIISVRSQATPTPSMNTRGKNKRLRMADSNGNSGKVINMNGTEDNSGMLACKSDIMEVEVREELLKFSNRNTEVKAEERSSVTMPVTPMKKLEMKTPKKRKRISVTGRPTTVKELFKTGLLEGYPVFYNGGKKGILLRGIVKGTRILCSCDLCKGTRVVTACQFEIHACEVYKRASYYICLENGKSLRDVIKECMRVPLETLKEAVQTLVGPVPVKKSLICENCKGSFVTTLAGKGEQPCDSCISSLRSEATRHSMSNRNGRNKKMKMVDSNLNSSGRVINMDEMEGNSGIHACNSGVTRVEVMEESEIRQFKLSTLKPKTEPVEFVNGNSEGKVKGKRGITMSVTPTKKLSRKMSETIQSVTGTAPTQIINTENGTNNGLKMVDSKKKKIPVTGRPMTVTELFKTGLLEGLTVFYNGGKKGILLRGTIRGSGILCSCGLCMGTRVVCAEQFEAHAYKIKRKASNYICFENGKSLRDVIKECMKDSSKPLEETIQNVIGIIPFKKSLICQDCKDKSFLEPLCEACVISFKSEATPAKPINSENGLLEFESSATKRYLERCGKKAVLPAIDEYSEMQREISDSREKGFHDLVVPPDIAPTRFDTKQSEMKSYPDVPSGFPPCIVNPEDNTFFDASPAMPNDDVLPGSIVNEAAKERSSVKPNCSDFAFLDRRLGKLERLVAYLRSH